MNNKKNHITVYSDFSIFYTYGILNKFHANHCAKVVIAEDPITVLYNSNKLYAKGFIIKSDALHQVNPNTRLVISVYLDPESATGNAINALVNRNVLLKLETSVADRMMSFFKYSFHNHVNEFDIKKQLIRSLIPTQLLHLESTVDNRIQAVIGQIKTAPGFNVKFYDLLAACALSESRLIHLFKKEIGINIRRYILWCRMQKALRSMTGGSTIKEAARSAGFTDGAHLSHTFVTMFGVAPSLLK